MTRVDLVEYDFFFFVGWFIFMEMFCGFRIVSFFWFSFGGFSFEFGIIELILF